jgi:putative Holliday junction resolvase
MSRLGRRLAFDYGDTRIGVAVCDPDGILATPLEFLTTKHPSLNKSILDLFNEYQPTKVYVGLPLNLSGEHSESTAKAIAFSEFLSEVLTCPVELLTTSSASASLSQAGVNVKDQRKKIDSQSAVVILESGLAKDRE